MKKKLFLTVLLALTFALFLSGFAYAAEETEELPADFEQEELLLTGNRFENAAVYVGGKKAGADGMTDYRTTYSGSAKKPSVKVKLNGKTLDSKYYSVSYSDNKNAGTATVRITGKKKYEGSEAAACFTIARKSVSSFTVSLSSTSYSYTGEEKAPSVTLKNGSTKIGSSNYTVRFENNVEPGKAKAVIEGVGNYTGSVSKSFSIKPAAPAGVQAFCDCMDSGCEAIALTWEPAVGADFYKIYRGDTLVDTITAEQALHPGGTRLPETGEEPVEEEPVEEEFVVEEEPAAELCHWYDTRVKNGSRYSYRVRAVKYVNGSTLSGSKSSEVKCRFLEDPIVEHILVFKGYDLKLFLAENAKADAYEVRLYDTELKPAEGVEPLYASEKTEIIIPGLAGGDYLVSVRAVTASAASAGKPLLIEVNDEDYQPTEYEYYRYLVESIDTKQARPQKQTCELSSSHKHAGGMCGVDSITTLLNRALALDGIYTNQFKVETILNQLGVQYEGPIKCPRDGRQGYVYLTEKSRTYSTTYYHAATKFCFEPTHYDNYDCQRMIRQYGSLENFLVELLKQHPEGVFLYGAYYSSYTSSGGHAIVVSDYKITSTGKVQFYVIDPVNVLSGDLRMKMEKAWINGTTFKNGKFREDTLDIITYTKYLDY